MHLGWLGYRDAVDARKARLAAHLWWPGGPGGDAFKSMSGTLRLVLEEGQLRDIEPGAGRMLGLLSVAQLPRRLSLDFSDVTGTRFIRSPNTARNPRASARSFWGVAVPCALT